MNRIDLLSLLTLLLYAVAFIAAIAGLLARNHRVKRGAFGLALAGFALHCLLLLVWQLSPRWENVSRSVFLLPLAWWLVAVGLAMWWKWRLDVLLLFSPPLAFILLFVSLVLHSADASLPLALSGPVFSLHIGAVSIGIGLIAVAAGAAVIFLWQEKSLKTKTHWAGFRRDLPALASLDRLNAAATIIGFPFYSLGVLCGFAWARMTWGTLLSGDPKELLSLFIWVCYAGLFHQRLGHGWLGRKPAILTLVIFAASMFSLFVVNTLFPTHHSFGF
jgi:ABC-type transport system involved in cytochrome c biogenesis permease subunit